MTTVKDIVWDHLEHTFEKEAWQPSLAIAVEGLTAAQALCIRSSAGGSSH